MNVPVVGSNSRMMICGVSLLAGVVCVLSDLVAAAVLLVVPVLLALVVVLFVLLLLSSPSGIIKRMIRMIWNDESSSLFGAFGSVAGEVVSFDAFDVDDALLLLLLLLSPKTDGINVFRISLINAKKPSLPSAGLLLSSGFGVWASVLVSDFVASVAGLVVGSSFGLVVATAGTAGGAAIGATAGAAWTAGTGTDAFSAGAGIAAGIAPGS